MNTQRDIYRFTDNQPYHNVVDVGFEPDESGHPINRGTSTTNFLGEAANSFESKYSHVIWMAKIAKYINKKTLIGAILAVVFLVATIGFVVVVTQNQNLNAQVDQLKDINSFEQTTANNSHVVVINLPKDDEVVPSSTKKKHHHQHNLPTVPTIKTTSTTSPPTAAAASPTIPVLHQNNNTHTTSENSTIRNNTTPSGNSPTISPGAAPTPSNKPPSEVLVGPKSGNDSSSGPVPENERPQGDAEIDPKLTDSNGNLKHPTSLLYENGIRPEFQIDECKHGKSQLGFKASATVYGTVYVGYGIGVKNARKDAAASIVTHVIASYPLSQEEKDRSSKVKEDCDKVL